MLQRDEGTTISAISRATGWQTHSVRGFLAGVVRKKLKFNLRSEHNGEVRRYFIDSGRSSKGSAVATEKTA
jgi:hypothetical protein